MYYCNIQFVSYKYVIFSLEYSIQLLYYTVHFYLYILIYLYEPHYNNEIFWEKCINGFAVKYIFPHRAKGYLMNFFNIP